MFRSQQMNRFIFSFPHIFHSVNLHLFPLYVNKLLKFYLNSLTMVFFFSMMIEMENEPFHLLLYFVSFDKLY